MEFEWEPEKAETNEQKHGVSFHEGTSVFGDPLAITFSDPDHSDEEERYLTFGLSKFEICCAYIAPRTRKHSSTARPL